MKIKRFHARTMREALKQVREEQGPDSVILSKQRIGDGIEVIAAVDYDEALLHQSNQVFGGRAVAGGTPIAPAPLPAAAQPGSASDSTGPEVQEPAGPSLGSFFARVYSDTAAGRVDNNVDDDDDDGRLNDPLEDDASDTVDFRSIFDATDTVATLAEPGQDTAGFLGGSYTGSSTGSSAGVGLLEVITAQLTSLQRTVDHQYTELHWDALQRRKPHLADVIQRLDGLGLSRSLVLSIVSGLPPGGDDGDVPLKKAWRHAIGLLAKRIPVAAQDVCEEGGIFAVVGPTGAGKTTSIAKLAARFALEHDPQLLGLVTTDSFRIGAQEHLLRFGRILGVPVQVAGTPELLRNTLNQLADRKLILIDTAGFNPNDEAMLDNLENLTRHSPTVQTLLALPANLQTAALRQAIRTFDRLGLDGAIATKVDESTSLGGLLTSVIEADLSVCYVADGQRVPEDLKPASRFRAGFVSQAVSLAKTYNEQHGESESASNRTENAPSSKLHAITTNNRVASYG